MMYFFVPDIRISQVCESLKTIQGVIVVQSKFHVRC